MDEEWRICHKCESRVNYTNQGLCHKCWKKLIEECEDSIKDDETNGLGWR